MAEVCDDRRRGAGLRVSRVPCAWIRVRGDLRRDWHWACGSCREGGRMGLSSHRAAGSRGLMAVDAKAVDRMTRPLRRAHFRVWIALAVLLPALFALGLAARRNTTPANPGLSWERYK